MSRLPSRPHDPNQGFADRLFFSGRQRYLMNDRARTQLALSKSSRPSSPKSSLAPTAFKSLYGQPSTPHFVLCNRGKPHSTAHHAWFHHYLRPVLLTSTTTHQSKPIALAPCSGSVQYIFSPPARLRSRFPCACAYCRRAAELKMLCITFDHFEVGLRRFERADCCDPRVVNLPTKIPGPPPANRRPRILD